MAEQLHAETDAETGARWYIHPQSGERFISVTTVLGKIGKYGLPNWSARLTAEAAFDHLPRLNAAALLDPCNSEGDDACGNCPDCVKAWLKNRHNETRDHAASVGKRLHDAAEHHTLFGPGGHVDDEVQPLAAQYQKWVTEWQPQFSASEMTVISRKWGYAGTLDWIASFAEANLPKGFKDLAGLNLVGDTKTSKTVDICKGWQVIAYANADTVLLPDGSEQPMPEIGGGLLLHIRPDTPPQVRRVHLSLANFAKFIHLLRVAEGLDAGLNTVLSRPYTVKEN